VPESARPAKAATVATWSELQDRQPAYALIAGVDLVVIRYNDEVSVFYGRCLHRGALLADGHVAGLSLVCGVHNWDYRLDSGVSEYNNAEALPRFGAWVDRDQDQVVVDEDEIGAWVTEHPQPYQREEYLGLYADIHGTPEEPYNSHIQELARNGLEKLGEHGAVSAMGVALTELPRWEDLQVLTGQLARLPLIDGSPVDTTVVIGPRAGKPLELEIPLFVSDMSFRALSEEAKTALATGAEMAGTGICSGEGGILPEEQAANSRYFYELASARFGYSLDKVQRCQAFHFKGGQGAKTGPVGIATQQPRLRERLIVEASATRLKNYLQASIELMKLLARACGHARLADFNTNDLTTWKREIAYLTGVSCAGVVPLGA